MFDLPNRWELDSEVLGNFSVLARVYTNLQNLFFG